MNNLNLLKATKPKSVTQDMKILTSIDEIEHRIDEDAREITEQIQQRLMKEVSGSRDGIVSINETLSSLHGDTVLSKLTKWAKMQRYSLSYNDGKIYLIPNNVKLAKFKSKFEYCKICNKTFNRFIRKCIMISSGIFSLGLIGMFFKSYPPGSIGFGFIVMLLMADGIFFAATGAWLAERIKNYNKEIK